MGIPRRQNAADETLEAALARELAEELGVTAKIGREIYRTQHRYAEMSEPIELIFFAASAPPVEIRNLIFERIEWRDPHSLPALNFLPADRELIEKLASGESHPRSCLASRICSADSFRMCRAICGMFRTNSPYQGSRVFRRRNLKPFSTCHKITLKFNRESTALRTSDGGASQVSPARKGWEI